MLVKEKRITRATFVLDEEERSYLFHARMIADCFLATLKDNRSNEMMNLATGEILEQKHIEQLKGILSAMENPHWEIVK